MRTYSGHAVLQARSLVGGYVPDFLSNNPFSMSVLAIWH
jgi:hypothetical protein